MSLLERIGYAAGGELDGDRFYPYYDHLAPDVLLLLDGSVLGVLHCAGAPFRLIGTAERNGQTRRHVAWLNSVADENVEVYEYLVRHDAVAPLPSRPADPSPYGAALLADWHASIAGKLRTNDWFIVVRVKPRADPLDWIPAWVPGVRRTAKLAPHELARQLDQIMQLAARTLRDVRPVRLGVRRVGEIVYSEIMEALHLIKTVRYCPQPLVDAAGTLGAALHCDEVLFGPRGFEIRWGVAGTPAATSYGCMLGFRVPPRKLDVARLDELLELDGSFVMMHGIKFLTRAQNQDALDLLQRHMVVAGDRATGDIADLDDAIDRVASGRSERGNTRWSMALHVRAHETAPETLAALDQLATLARNVLANAGAKIAIERQGALSAFQSQMPGAPEKCWIRPASLDTAQFARISTLAGFPRGAARTRWGGAFRMLTTGATPYDHDIFVGDVAHAAFIGPNGAGKTVFTGMAIVANDALVRPNGGTQLVFDVDSSNEQTILALGGTYAAIRTGEDSGVAPLRLPDSARTRSMLRDLVAGLSEWDKTSPQGAAERKGIAAGVEFVMGEMAPEERTFATIRRFMGYQEGGAGERFEPWCRGAELGWAFDGERHDLDFNVGLAGVDLTQVMHDQHVMPPMAQVLLWMASEMMDGRRCVVVLEEAPAYLPDPRFARIAKGIALRARKRNAAMFLIAQQPDDLLVNEAGRALLKQARQFVLFANDKADWQPYHEATGCTPAEFDQISNRMLGLPYWPVLIKRRDGQSTVNQFDLSSLPEHLAVLSGTTRSVALMRAVWRAMPDAPIAARLTEFWRRLPEAAA